MNIGELAHRIANRETEAVFGIPGSGPSFDLLLALESEGVRFHLSQSESGGALMAAGYARASGHPGVAICVRGPGFANILGGLATAKLEGIPLIAISESPKRLDTKHKFLDQDSLARPLVKAYCSLGAEPSTIDDCINSATRWPTGPILIQLSESNSVMSVCESQRAPTPSHHIYSLLRNSERPVIIAGALAVHEKLGPLVTNLAIPVFTTPAAKGLIDENEPHSAGVFNGRGGSKTNESLLGDADVVIGLGLVEDELLRMTVPTERLVNASYSSSGTGHVVDIAHASHLIDCLKDRDWLPEKRSEVGKSDSFTPTGVIAYLNAINSEYRLVVDTGLFSLAAERRWVAHRPGLYLGTPNSRSMGAAIPLGIGASLGDRATPVIVIVGDGGIGMYATELLIAMSEQLPLLILHFANDTLASVTGKRSDTRSEKIGRASLPGSLLDGLGLTSSVVSTTKALESNLEGWFGSSQNPMPHFIRAEFEPDSYERDLEGFEIG